MRVLITGALGYIGGRLVAYLRRFSEFELRLLVRRVPRELSAWVHGLDVREGDLTRPETLQGLCEGVDRVVHLAALNEVDSARDPTAAVRVNVEGTLHLMQALTPSVTRVVYMSTFHVYGASGYGRVTEDTPLAPVHSYAATHAMAEMYLTMHARQHHNEAVVFRLSNSYGAPLYLGVNRWTLLVNDLCRQAMATGRLVLRSSGEEVRDFVALDDVVQAVKLVLSSRLDEADTLNLGGETTLSVLEVAQQVQDVYRELYGRELALERSEQNSRRRDKTLDFCIDRLRKLGYEPRGKLADGIRETLYLCEAFRPSLAGSG